MHTEPHSARTWHSVRCSVDPAWVESVVAACAELGSCGLQTEDSGSLVELTAYFPALQRWPILRQALARVLAELGLKVELEHGVVAEEDWGAAWRQYFRPIQVTPRLVVHPSWLQVAAAPPQIALSIDPKMAFGTGGHESTRLCLRALEEVLAPGACCLDLGTGSGILAIAAVHLGARRVLALDTDPGAIENARENLALNGVAGDRVELRLGGLEGACDRRFQIIMANIQSSVLAPLLPGLRRRLKRRGRLLLSGLLAHEAGSFGAAVGAAGLVVQRTLAEGEWICLVAGQRVGHA